MQLCDDRKHDEIVHDGKYCPLCAAITSIAALQGEIDALKNEIDNHECAHE